MHSWLAVFRSSCVFCEKCAVIVCCFGLSAQLFVALGAFEPCSVSQRCALAVLCAMDLSALATAAKSRGIAHTNPIEELNKIAPNVTAILDDIQRTSEGTTEKVESLLKLLVEHGLCWTERLPPWKVGIDKDNRNGLGVDPVDAHKLGARLLCNGALGWSLHAL